MKNGKLFLMALLSSLATSLLVGCNSSNDKNNDSIPDDSEEPKPIEIGDTVKEWTGKYNFESAPLDVKEAKQGKVEINNEFGNYDNCSLECSITSNYIGSDAIDEPYFLEEDAKNGDIISLCFYLPEDHNIASLQLSVLSSSALIQSAWGSSGDTILADQINIDENKEGKWIRTELSFDSLETLGAIRLNVTRADSSLSAHFYIDDINITLGLETVKTGYEYNDESLYETYEDYLKIGTCMSASMLRNTELRKILKNDFNSVTAENEGKPEQILDQAACQELLRQGHASGVAIKTSPFEKLYSFAEANHIGVRHHTFVWFDQTPSWFFTEDYAGGQLVSRNVMLDRMENFIKVTLETINDRWPGLVYAIDVANEAIENGGTRTNNNNWYKTVGKDFVARAFEFAYEYKDEDQELYYNDFSFDYNYSHCQYAINTLLKEPIENGWIDGVGIQGHIDADQNMENVMNDAKLIKQAGLKCQITELDIETRGSGDGIWEKQGQAYALLMKKILENNANGDTEVNAVIVWGIVDNLSWKRSNNPLLFDSNYAKKASYYGVLNAVKEYEENM